MEYFCDHIDEYRYGLSVSNSMSMYMGYYIWIHGYGFFIFISSNKKSYVTNYFCLVLGCVRELFVFRSMNLTYLYSYPQIWIISAQHDEYEYRLSAFRSAECMWNTDCFCLDPLKRMRKQITCVQICGKLSEEKRFKF